MPSAEARRALIERYRTGVDLLERSIAQVPEDAMHWRPAPGKWSVHEVICHCADSEMNAAARIRYLLCEDSPTILGYDQDCWAKTLDYEHHPRELAMAVTHAVRRNTVPILERLTDAEFAKRGHHTEAGEYSVDKWLETYAEHLEIHSRQIDRTLAAWKDAAHG